MQGNSHFYWVHILFIDLPLHVQNNDVPEFLIGSNCVEYRPAAVVLVLSFFSFSFDVLVFGKFVDLGERSVSGFLTELVFRMKNIWITKDVGY